MDGTDLNIARNENSPTYFPPQKNQDVGNNRFHANALYDLLNRTYKDVYVQPSPYQQERDAALVMIVISRLSGKDIVIADRAEVRRILREERVAENAALQLMHFLHDADPFGFLKE